MIYSTLFLEECHVVILEGKLFIRQEVLREAIGAQIQILCFFLKSCDFSELCLFAGDSFAL